jgi:hypothetical protein
MTKKKIVADLPLELAEMLDKKASSMMIGRTAVLRMALKDFCE